MIYRILVNSRMLSVRTVDGETVVEWVTTRFGGPGGSHGFALGGVMWELGLPAPSVGNQRGRFFFTERGWDGLGRILAAEARRRGHVVRVIRQKRPKPSRDLFRDAYQVAVLQEKRRDRAQHRAAHAADREATPVGP